MSDELHTVLQKVSDLEDLVRRRLLEDRAKNQLIQAAQDHLAAREALDSGLAFRDVFSEALLATDRLRTGTPDADLVESVADELLTVFSRRGLVAVPEADVFDPRYHEVVGQIPANDGQALGEIVSVEREGYLLGDTLLRPARVVIVGEPVSVES